MNIMVLGCEGQLGVSLVKFLLLTDWHIIALNKSMLDIADSERVAAIVHKYRPDVIINAAAYTAVDLAQTHTSAARAVNYCGVVNLVNAAEKIGALLIHFSTDYVFDGSKVGPYVESDLAAPLNIYGETKRAGELAVMDGASKFIIVRTSWLFGEYGNNFFTSVNKLLQTNAELRIVSDQVGGPTYVADLAKLVVQILHNVKLDNFSSWGIYHYGGFPYVSWYEFACAIKTAHSPDYTCRVIPIASSNYLLSVTRPLNSSLDSSKVFNFFGTPPSDWLRAVNLIVGH